ncbi:MAG: HDIG domain-containing protein [Bacteroidetes bacterium]|jgi:putative nucleotidyltransferase with HDIG domain|nr:HDIG domain-containing protein [Bacteroidota bacterium]
MIKKLFSYLQHNYYELFKISLFVLTAFILIWQMPSKGKFKYEYSKGKPWQQERLFAPFDFAIYKNDELLKKEQQAIVDKVYPYFILQDELNKTGREKLIEDFKRESKFDSTQNLPAQNKQLKLLVSIYDSIQSRGVLAYHPAIEDLTAVDPIHLVKNKVVIDRKFGDVFTVKSAYDHALNIIDTLEGDTKSLFASVLANSFVQNLNYDKRMTDAERSAAIAQISPTYGMVQQGELIISEGELVDDEKFAELRSLQKAYEQRVGTLSEQNAILAGQAILVFAIIFALFFFLRIIRRDVYDELKKINMLLLLMLLILLPSYFILDFNPQLIILMPFGLLPIILITFFDTRMTMMVHLLTITILGLVVPNPYNFMFAQLVIGFVVLFGLEKHNKRIYYFRTSVLIFVGYVLVYMGFNLIQERNVDNFSWMIIGGFALSALFTSLALPLIYLLERIFGTITDLTLLELSNTNNPLLRELAQKAPGSFQHSMQVANLSEEALFEIGGDTLLARTGALYHDIGKMDNPIYFIENQMGGYNPHDDISATESARIIVEHVTKGIEKARKAKLPEQIIDFIRTHHGNRRVEYFYFMEQKAHPGLTLDERDFSYHGPIPFSKETAVVMMADSVEAASRSLKNPTEQKINDLIENIISKQLAANQFVNANITFKEVNTVKKVLKKKLMNIYHVRIAYPD